jgi:3-dehydroquinate synthase
MTVIKAKAYDVTVTTSLQPLSDFLKNEKYSSVYILCDSNTLRYCLPKLLKDCPSLSKAQLLKIKSGERNKSLVSCTKVWKSFIETNADRKALLINLGGGVVTDLGGFAASVYKRGIQFINVPTSLMAMADASIGGKNGIDFYNLKNSLGTFTQPKAVFICTEFLNTLPKTEFKNGCAEMFKMALITDERYWQQLKSITASVSESQLIKCIQLKNKIVLKDPFDEGLRKVLNFGHSVGHAIEAVLLTKKLPVLHGMAVFAGMFIESHIALQKRWITKASFTEITSTLEQFIEMPDLNFINEEELIANIKNDKKNKNGLLLFALINAIGKSTYDVPVSHTQITKAITFYNQRYGRD